MISASLSILSFLLHLAGRFPIFLPLIFICFFLIIMPVSTSLTHLVLLVSFSASAFAAPRPMSSFPLSMNLHRRVPQARSADDIAAWAKAHKLNVEAKYGNPSSVEKRSTSGQSLYVVVTPLFLLPETESDTNRIVNQAADSRLTLHNLLIISTH